MKEIIIINGPNLNLVGKREPEIYGDAPILEFIEVQKKLYPNLIIDYFQSNMEGEIISRIQDAANYCDGILLNAGGYTHTSIAIADAIAAIDKEVIEIHISQPQAREVQRHISLIAKHCKGSISGFGLNSYKLGIEYFNHKFSIEK